MGPCEVRAGSYNQGSNDKPSNWIEVINKFY